MMRNWKRFWMGFLLLAGAVLHAGLPEHEQFFVLEGIAKGPWKAPKTQSELHNLYRNEVPDKGDVRLMTNLTGIPLGVNSAIPMYWKEDLRKRQKGSWEGVFLDEKGDLKVRRLQLTREVVLGMPCSGVGWISRDDNGLLLSCQCPAGRCTWQGQKLEGSVVPEPARNGEDITCPCKLGAALARCPPGSVVSGGGYKVFSPRPTDNLSCRTGNDWEKLKNHTPSASYPDKGGWKVEAGRASDQCFRAFAVCLQ